MESCRVWTKTQAHRSQRFDVDVATEAAWVNGFISAFNFYQGGADVAQSTDVDGYLAWIDNYCAAHPLDQISSAVIKLIEELSQRKVQQ